MTNIIFGVDDDTLADIQQYKDRYKLSRAAICRLAIAKFFEMEGKRQ